MGCGFELFGLLEVLELVRDFYHLLWDAKMIIAALLWPLFIIATCLLAHVRGHSWFWGLLAIPFHGIPFVVLAFVPDKHTEALRLQVAELQLRVQAYEQRFGAVLPPPA